MESSSTRFFEELVAPPPEEKPPGYQRRYEAGLELAVAGAAEQAVQGRSMTVATNRRLQGREFDVTLDSGDNVLMAAEVQKAPKSAMRAGGWYGATSRSLRSKSWALLSKSPSSWFCVLVFVEPNELEHVAERFRQFVTEVVDAAFVADIASDRVIGLTGQSSEGLIGEMRLTVDGLFNTLVDLAQRAKAEPPPRTPAVARWGSAAANRRSENRQVVESRLTSSHDLELALPDGAPWGAPIERRDRPNSTTTVLLVASEWNSKQGGLSTFNRDLAGAIANAGANVFCFVPDADEDEKEDARINFGVRILTAPNRPGLREHERLLRRPPLPDGVVPDIVVGHGRVLGAYAREIQEQHYPNAGRLHIVHTRSEALEWAKPLDDETARRGEERKDIERELARSATVVAGGGPNLQSYANGLLRGPGRTRQAIELLPGLPDIEPVPDLPQDRLCLVLGRADDIEVKGLDLAARALSRYARHPRLLGHVPRLVVRGAPTSEENAIYGRLRAEAGDVT